MVQPKHRTKLLVPFLLLFVISVVYKSPVGPDTNIKSHRQTLSSQAVKEQDRDLRQDEEESLFDTIQVFHAKRDPTELSDRKWSAQVKQDEIVAALTNSQRNGYFVDLASNHAITLSNTYGLERNLEWNGICIEGNSKLWGELVRRQCQLVAAVVGQSVNEKISFMVRPQKDGLSGIVNDKFDNKDANKQGKEVTIVEEHYAVPLQYILKHNHAPKVIDYLSLDVEGAEFYVMEKFPFDEYLFRIITIERPQPELRSLLRDNNYILHAVIAGRHHGETLWFHKDHVSSLNVEEFANKFNLPNQEAEMAKWV